MTPPETGLIRQRIKALPAAAGLFSSLDLHFADFIGRLSETKGLETPMAAALVSCKTREGNVCLDLAEYAGKFIGSDPSGNTPSAFACPSLPEWRASLLASGVVVQGRGDTPLVLDPHSRLYLRRYWDYENVIAAFIRERAATSAPAIDRSGLAENLRQLFTSAPGTTADWQQLAALAAATRSFCVISGGPGTGKTSTVAKILALLLRLHNGPGKLRILLGAPTGKAASRLQDAIASTGLLPPGNGPLLAMTLHRMLDSRPHSPYFKHNAENHLPADIIVIDEASMIDLPLMAKFMQAVPPAARLILLGDRHQLASVQPGSVLGDICAPDMIASFSDEFRRQAFELTGSSLPPAPQRSSSLPAASLQDSFVELVHSYRFSPGSDIARLSLAVKEGDAEVAMDILLSKDNSQAAWSETPPAPELHHRLRNWPGFTRYASLQEGLDPGACFEALDTHRILCGLRSGPFGMERINALLAQQFAPRQKADSGQRRPAWHEPAGYFPPGTPVMITENDYTLRLFNGDVGIILPDPFLQKTLRVFFREESGALRTLAPAMLPGHEPVFAMTVHKSQGSEFDRVLLILPDQDSPLLTRELLYTAITRARDRVEIWGRRDIFCNAVRRCIKRSSGLADALRNPSIP